MNATELRRMANGLELLEDNVEARENLISKFDRLKPNVPFSVRLNNYITKAVKVLEARGVKFIYTDTDDFDENDIEGTLARHRKRFFETNEIHIWTGGSDFTIFGDRHINHKFRAWHDYIHITQNLGFDAISECIVADIQKSQLPKDWLFERELIHIEVAGQVQYFHMHNKFIEDQRQFAVDYMFNPLKALK